MRETCAALWPLFDDDNSGEIDKEEYMRADGLGDMLEATLENERPIDALHPDGVTSC